MQRALTARTDGRSLFIGLIALLVPLVYLSIKGGCVSSIFAQTFAAMLMVTMLYAAHYGKQVRDAAKAVAAGSPYCIQSGNKTVSDVLDLTILNLRAGAFQGWHALNYHALLVVDSKQQRQFYNWSYYRSRFEPAHMTYEPDVICTPVSITP